MGAQLRGSITRALPDGLVWGWLFESKSKDLRSSLVDWAFELKCDNIRATDAFVVQRKSHEFSATQGGIFFHATIPPHIIRSAREISLVAKRGDECRILDVATVQHAIAGIDGVREDGTVTGWALPGENGPRALVVAMESEQIGTILADRYHPDFPVELLGFVGFSVVVPTRGRQVGQSRSLEVRDAVTGHCLVRKLLKRLPPLDETRVGILPTDAVIPPDLGSILDGSSIDSFVARYGLESFVKVSFAYVLEREASSLELEAFGKELAAGAIGPADMIEGLLASEERRRRGAFVGAFSDESDYPFLPHGFDSERATNRAPQKRRRNAKQVERVQTTLARFRNQSSESVTTSIGHQSSLSRSLYIKRYVARLVGIFRGDAAQRMISLADRARDKRDWHSAGALYREALSLKPKLHDIWVQYGHSLKETGQFAAAEASYRTALAIDSTAADTHLQLGHVLKLQGKIEEARDAYLKAAVIGRPEESSGRLARIELGNLQ